MAFGISPDVLALSPSTVLQNIIQKKQLAARERERATQERLALKRIAAQEAAAAEQTRQFEVSQAGRGEMTDYQKWLQENWGKMTDAQRAEETRKAEKFEIEKTARQQAMDEAARITEGLAEPVVQPVVQPAVQAPVQPAQDLTTITPEAGFAGLPDYLKRQPAPVAPAIAPAITPTTYTPPADIAGYLEQFPDRKANLETAQSRIQPFKLTKREKLLIDLQTLDQTNLPKSRKDSLIAQNKEIKARRTQNFELEKGIRDEHISMREELKAERKELAKPTTREITRQKRIVKYFEDIEEGMISRSVKDGFTKDETKRLKPHLKRYNAILKKEGKPELELVEEETFGFNKWRLQEKGGVGKYTTEQEALIQENVSSHGRSREEVIKKLKAKGLL